MRQKDIQNRTQQIRIAIVVQDGMKDHLIRMLTLHKGVLFANYVVSTKGTAEYMLKMLDLEVDEKVPSGKDGGDTKIANMVVDGTIDILIFLLNPMKTFSHSSASDALIRECIVSNVPIALNAATADIVLSKI